LTLIGRANYRIPPGEKRGTKRSISKGSTKWQF
jgi:hypothetical protein